MRLTWVQPEDLVTHGFAQARADGTDPAELERRWVQAGGAAEAPVSGASDTASTAELRSLAAQLLDRLDDLAGLESRPAGPDSWEALSGSLSPAALAPPGPEALADRMHGAWLGRSAGCLLGKPVEKIPRPGIEEILRSTGRWPLDGYFTAAGLDPDVAARWPWNRRSAPTSLAENIDGMPEDDDLNFAVLALRMAEQHGTGLTTEQVAQAWLDNLPGGRVFTAERVAYRNLLSGIEPPRTALVRNPFREWIGALIRADAYGWVLPGRLSEASRLAWVDARLSHTGAGIQGAMWAAALASAAVCAESVDDVLAAARTVVPQESSLAAAVALGEETGHGAAELADALDVLHAAYGHLHWVHVLNNAATIAFALARGKGEFGTSVSAAVMAGWDTDSVGATVGGVVGALLGAEAMPRAWVAPLDNRLATSLPGPAELALGELAAQTVRVAGALA